MTRNCRALALIAAVSLPWSPAFAGPQEAVDAKATIDTVEVTAQREALRKAIHGFVANVTRFDGENVARWRFPICPSVIGATADQGEFIRSRILDVAVAAGAPVDRDLKKCQSNLLVILTTQPDPLWATWKKTNPKMFADYSAQTLERTLGTKPVQTLQNAVLNNADGTTPYNSWSHRLRDSHIVASVSEDISSVIVVVDTSRTGGATFGQLADYVAMAALARIDLSADFAASASILRLFSTDSAGAPARLTDWDQAFLKTLYAVDISDQRPRSLIVRTMTRDIAPEPQQ